MNVAFFEAKCTDECTMPRLGKCLVGQMYKLNSWEARAFFGCFDIKNAKTYLERVKLDDQPDDENRSIIEEKERQQQEFLDLIKAEPKPKKEQPKKNRKEEVEEMGAGKLNDLLAHYDLPKLNHKDKNAALVLQYEELLEKAKDMTPEQRLEALKKLEVEIPSEGDFDQAAAIAKAACIADIDEADLKEDKGGDAEKPKKDAKKK